MDTENTQQAEEEEKKVFLKVGVDFPARPVTYRHRVWAIIVDLLLVMPIAGQFSLSAQVDSNLDMERVNQAQLDAQAELISRWDLQLIYFDAMVESGIGKVILLNGAIAAAILGVIFVWMWQRWGATPGKMVLGMKIVNESDFEKPSLTVAIIRYVSLVLTSVFFCVGPLWSAFDKEKRQMLHDKISHTRLVYTYPVNPDAKKIRFKYQSYMFMAVLIVYLLYKAVQ